MRRPFRHIANRVSLALSLSCWAMLIIGLGIELLAKSLLFEDYLSTFSAWGIIFGLIYYLTRQRGHRPGFCQICGYDLRASEAQCPECGAPISSSMPPPPRRRW